MSNITTRPLSSKEIATLINKSKQPWKSIFFLSAFYGIRISDLMKLPFQEHQPDHPIYEQKTGKSIILPNSPLCVCHWRNLYKYGNTRAYLFPFSDISTYRKALVSHAKRFGISTERLAFHSLRKSHAVIAYRTGGIVAAKTAMNHSSVSTTERYVSEALKLEISFAFDNMFSPGELFQEGEQNE